MFFGFLRDVIGLCVNFELHLVVLISLTHLLLTFENPFNQLYRLS